MATVTYKNQPAIQSTGGHVTDAVKAGKSHLYHVKKVLWPKAIESFLETILIGKSLHVCSGKSKLGDIRLDLNEQDVDIKADAVNMPIADNEYDTVLCDPPYNGKFKWNHDLLQELARVAKKRIIFQHWFIPATPDGRYKKAQEKFALSAVYIWQPKTYFGRAQVISVFDCIVEEMLI